MARFKKQLIVGSISLIGLMALMAYFFPAGRTMSRYLGQDYAQVLKIQDMEKFISLSFDNRDGSTVKDVTFQSTDGQIYTQEFKDISPLEGTIRWVPAGEGSSAFQSRTMSRWFGTAVELELPANCRQILDVDVGSNGEGERVKNLTYLAADGRILSKEYREGFLDRLAEGWLEIKSVKN